MGKNSRRLLWMAPEGFLLSGMQDKLQVFDNMGGKVSEMYCSWHFSYSAACLCILIPKQVCNANFSTRYKYSGSI